MFLSQRIAKNVNFLREYPDAGINAFDTRIRILRSTKIIVSSTLFTHSSFSPERTHAAYVEMDKKQHQYIQFAKLPFDSIFIENETGGILVEKYTKQSTSSRDAAQVTIIHYDGLIWPIRVKYWIEQTDEGEKYLIHPHISKQAGPNFLYNVLEFSHKTLKGDVHESTMRLLMNMAHLYLHEVFEVLLFMNVRNKLMKNYQSQKKELIGVPKAMLPFYEYRILDLYREHTTYVSIADIEMQMSKTNEVDQRRAHVVRGHFKNINGGLYWWNSFMRSRKNLLTHGVVKKDYHLVE